MYYFAGSEDFSQSITLTYSLNHTQDLAARLATACLSHPKYADNLTLREAQLLCLYRTGDLSSFTKEVSKA